MSHNYVRHCGVSLDKQHGYVACEKRDYSRKKEGCSRDAKRWHIFTTGGIPVCDVCKRVGHVARNCWRCMNSSANRRTNPKEKQKEESARVIHSVVERRKEGLTMMRHIPVSVNGKSLNAQLDCDALENAVDLGVAKEVGLIFKVHSFYGVSSWTKGVVGMTWLPVVIGLRSEKLRCVVVENLGEKLIIGLPGMSFLGMKIDFATGDVRIGHRSKRRKVKDVTTVEDEDVLLQNQDLVKETKIKEAVSEKVTKVKVEQSSNQGSKMKPHTPSQVLEQAKKLKNGKKLQEMSCYSEKCEILKQKGSVWEPGGMEGEKDTVNLHEANRTVAQESDSDDDDTEGESENEGIAELTDDEKKTKCCNKANTKARKGKQKKNKRKGKKSKKGKKK